MGIWTWVLIIGGGYWLYKHFKPKPSYEISIPPLRIPWTMTEAQFQELKTIIQNVFQVTFTPKFTEPTGIEYSISIPILGFKYTGLYKMTRSEMAQAAIQFLTAPQKLSVTREPNAIIITIPTIYLPKA